LGIGTEGGYCIQVSAGGWHTVVLTGVRTLSNYPFLEKMFAEILKQRAEGDFYYSPDQYNFFISLMKKFELAYELDDSTLLLPSLLEIQEPNFEFDYEGTLRFIIDYDFLPPSVIPRFIVKMNKYIKDNLRWRAGVVLEDKNLNSSAVVRANIEAKRISIYVKGNQRRDYFSSILFNLREINNSFEKLKAVEKIPLPDEPEIAVSYDHLVYLEEIGEDRYRPEGSRKAYNVKDLLGTVNIKKTEQELLEEILSILKNVNQNEEEKFEKIVSVLSNLAMDQAEESDNWETLSKKLNKIIMLQPNWNGLGFNINEAIDLAIDRYFKWKRKRK